MKQPDKRRALYESWVRDFGPDLYRCAARLCGREDCAEELVQEVFYEAWRSMDSLREPGKARVWLLGILRHRYMHWLRDMKRHPKQSAGENLEQTLASTQQGPEQALAQKEVLQGALDALEDRYKVPFLLVFLEGMTCQAAADFIGVPLGTVLSRIYRARQFMREHLERERPAGRRLTLHKDAPGRDEPRGASGGGR